MPRPGTIDRIAEVTGLALQASAVRCRTALSTQTAYRHYLLATYQYVQCSVPLMATALASERHKDLPWLGPYLAAHIKEESGHDAWLRDDLRVLGVTDAELDCILPPPEVLQLSGPQYHLIQHVHPVAVLGYIYVLESGPPDSTFLQDLGNRLGLPAHGMRTLALHATEDVQHGKDIKQLIESLPADGPHADLVVYSARLTAYGLLELIRSIKPVGYESYARLSAAL